MNQTSSVNLNPKEEADKLSDTVSKMAFDTYADKSTDAEKFIEKIICGQSDWSKAVFGMAVAKYNLLLLGEPLTQ